MPGLTDHIRAFGLASVKRDSPSKPHGRKILWTSSSMVAAQVLMAGAGVLAARKLGPEGRGIATGVLIWSQLLPYIAIAGFNSALTVRVAARPSGTIGTALGNGIAFACVVGGVCTGVAIVILPSILGRLGPDAFVLAIAALSTIPLSLLAQVVAALQLALDRIRLLSVCGVLGPTLILAGTIVLWALEELTPSSFVALTLGGGVASLILSMWKLPWRSARLAPKMLLADARFGLKVAVAGWLSLANVRLDLLVMSTFISASQIGFYSIANNVMIPVTTLAMAAAALLTPAVARIEREVTDVDPVASRQLELIHHQAMRYLLRAALGGAALAAVAPFALPLVYGKSFEPAVAMVWILIPGLVVRTYASIVVAGAIGMRRPSVGNIVEGTALVATLALLPILLPRFDAIGAAVTSTIAYGVAGLTAFVIVRRRLPPKLSAHELGRAS